MKKSVIVIICLAVALAIFFAFIPDVKMERFVDIKAPASVVREKTDLFKTYFDSATRRTFKFDFISRGDTTRLVWLFTAPDSNNPVAKAFWIFKKDKWQNDVMDKGLNDIKKVAEK